MPFITVCVAVIDQGRILLTQRDDWETWCLPSGGIEEGESAAEAAQRETLEETGIQVELTRLVGVYSRLGVMPDTHAVLFNAIPIGGELKTQPGETIVVRYFAPDEIPGNLSVGHRQRISDALAGVGAGIAVKQEMQLPGGQTFSLADIVQARKMPRQERVDYYQHMMRQVDSRSVVEVYPGKGDTPG